MKYLAPIVIGLAILLLTIYPYTNRQITNVQDYIQYLEQSLMDKAQIKNDQQITFWEEKLSRSPENHVYQKKLANLLAAKFKLSGQIQYLHQSDSLYQLVHQRFPKDVGVLHGLTANSITKHAFIDAQQYIEQAYIIGEKKFTSSLLMTDVYLERGNFNKAKVKIKDISTKQHFDYFIRLVKWNDQTGDLDKAVQNMERALQLAESSKNQTLINWSLSNLADMYGHQGRIAKSYSTYLKALKCNPVDLHALKGIAWITYSHEKNTLEAKRILTYLKKVNPLPDYDLMLSEIAAFEGNTSLEAYYLDQFLTEANRSIYGNMYNGYLCAIYAEDNNRIPIALHLAELEIEERPHPVNYSLLAWVTYLNGDNKKALDLIETYVIGKTEEPDALYRAAIIYKSNQIHKSAEQFLAEVKAAAFELGPMAMREIDEF